MVTHGGRKEAETIKYPNPKLKQKVKQKKIRLVLCCCVFIALSFFSVLYIHSRCWAAVFKAFHPVVGGLSRQTRELREFLTFFFCEICEKFKKKNKKINLNLQSFKSVKKQ